MLSCSVTKGLKGKISTSKLEDFGRINILATIKIKSVLLLAITSCCYRLPHVTNGFRPHDLCHRPLEKMVFQFFKANNSLLQDSTSSFNIFNWLSQDQPLSFWLTYYQLIWDLNCIFKTLASFPYSLKEKKVTGPVYPQREGIIQSVNTKKGRSWQSTLECVHYRKMFFCF